MDILSIIKLQPDQRHLKFHTNEFQNFQAFLSQQIRREHLYVNGENAKQKVENENQKFLRERNGMKKILKAALLQFGRKWRSGTL